MISQFVAKKPAEKAVECSSFHASPPTNQADCPAGKEYDFARFGAADKCMASSDCALSSRSKCCLSCGDGKYRSSESGNQCISCPNRIRERPNAAKDACEPRDDVKEFKTIVGTIEARGIVVGCGSTTNCTEASVISTMETALNKPEVLKLACDAVMTFVESKDNVFCSAKNIVASDSGSPRRRLNTESKEFTVKVVSEYTLTLDDTVFSDNETGKNLTSQLKNSLSTGLNNMKSAEGDTGLKSLMVSTLNAALSDSGFDLSKVEASMQIQDIGTIEERLELNTQFAQQANEEQTVEDTSSANTGSAAGSTDGGAKAADKDEAKQEETAEAETTDSTTMIIIIVASVCGVLLIAGVAMLVMRNKGDSRVQPVSGGKRTKEDEDYELYLNSKKKKGGK